MILSILICTMPSRKQMFDKLYLKLQSQINEISYGSSNIEILHDDDMSINIGAKRNRLLEKSKGYFVVFIDDDDDVFDGYVPIIYSAIKNNKNIDCIAFNGVITFAGDNQREWFISKDYKRWYEENGVYFRTPNHISPIKRSIAIKVKFPEISHGEDYVYSMQIYPHLKKEYKIKEDIVMYYYRYSNKLENKLPSCNDSNHPYRPAFR